MLRPSANGLHGAFKLPKPFFTLGSSAPQPVLPRRMTPKLSTILDSLQQQLLLLTELVARVATLPPADDQPRATSVTASRPGIALSEMTTARRDDEPTGPPSGG